MVACSVCGEKKAARVIGKCAECIRRWGHASEAKEIHQRIRRAFALPPVIPRSPNGKACTLCANACRPLPDQSGFCGVRWNEKGRMRNRFGPRKAQLYYYLDPLTTNCCAAWFCRGSRWQGYNLAVFFYGCNFDCLFCQNASHKQVEQAPVVTLEQLLQVALEPEVRCVCFFGGSPEPHLPFAIQLARRIVAETGGSKPICWEWNGAGNPALVLKAAELSARSGGTVKFDLKAFHPRISAYLCGVTNRRSFQNFSRIFRQFPQPDLLTATTLLVPYYVDAQEVAGIARFIARLDPNIPYSLLIFHPDFMMKDLPITPRAQVEACYRAARQYLHRVHIGNKHLLGWCA